MLGINPSIDFLRQNWSLLTEGLATTKTDCLNQLFSLYNSSNRHYHNLLHIEALLKLSEKYKDHLNTPDTIQFAIWYHDAIYNVAKNNNEEKSAELAREHLSAMKVNQAVVSDCYKLIIATKKHEVPNDLNTFDAKFLLDIDLSILAVPEKVYLQYTKQIRKEYSLYPNFLYNKGRKKVLQHFLDSKRIFKTDLFFRLYEKKARLNLTSEASLL